MVQQLPPIFSGFNRALKAVFGDCQVRLRNIRDRRLAESHVQFDFDTRSNRSLPQNQVGAAGSRLSSFMRSSKRISENDAR